VIAWLDELNGKLASGRDATRERVTAVADGLAAEVERLNRELAEARAQIAALTAALEQLRAASQA